MQRYKARLLFLGLECLLVFWSAHAAGAIDPFSTKKEIGDGRFGISNAAEICSRERMHQPLTLSDVVELTLCNNPKTRLQWASARQQAAQVGISKSAYLPTLSGPIAAGGLDSSTRASQQSITVSVNYLLYDFGGRAANLEASQHLLVAANATRDDVLRSTFLTAVEVYYNYMAAQASMQAFKVAENTANTGLAAATARVQAGAATQSEILQAKTALSQVRLNYIRAEGDATTAKGTLANTMGFFASQQFELAPITAESGLDDAVQPDAGVEENIGKLIEQAQKNRPDLFAAEAQIKAAEAQIDAIRASSKPIFTLAGSVNHSRSTEITEGGFKQSIRLSIHVPWFSGFRDVYRISAGQAVLDGKIAERDQVNNQIALDVWKAYQLMRINSQALRAASDLHAAAKLSEKFALGRYKAGVGSILDVLSAQGVLATAGQQKVGTLYDFKVSKFLLAQTIGILDLTMVEEKNPTVKLLTTPLERVIPPPALTDGQASEQDTSTPEESGDAEKIMIPETIKPPAAPRSSAEPTNPVALNHPIEP